MKHLNSKIKKGLCLLLILFILLFTGCEFSDFFDKNTCEVTFIYNDGVTSNLVIEVENNHSITMPNQPEKDRYEFIGWYLNGKEFDFSTLVTENITLEARFEIDEDLAETYSVKFMNGDEVYRKFNIKETRTIDEIDDPTKVGHTFLYWEYNNEPFDFTTQIVCDMVITAKYQASTIKVTFITNDGTFTQDVLYGTKATKPQDPTKANKQFEGWYKDGIKFNFDSAIISEITLTARFINLPGDIINVQYDFGYDCYQTKDDLRLAYYTDFYNFLVEKEFNFSKWEITDLNSFLEFLNTWTYKGRSEMGNIGTAFGSNYLTIEIGGKLEDQPDTTFIGWCYKNGKYVDFINHLMVFFAYWRTDEGYSKSDPNGNDFFASNWASMVDTAKFFYFTSDTLNNTYAWFKSERVKYALDHIPSVGYVKLKYKEDEGDSITLPTDVTREGYEFLGWFDDKNQKIEVVTESMTVHAKWSKAE